MSTRLNNMFNYGLSNVRGVYSGGAVIVRDGKISLLWGDPIGSIIVKIRRECCSLC